MVAQKHLLYFTEIDSLLQSPNQDFLLANTSLGARYLFNVAKDILRYGTNSAQKITNSLFKQVYSSVNNGEIVCLGTNDGVQLYHWDNLMQKDEQSEKQILNGSSIYSVCWSGSSVIGGGDNGLLVEADANTGKVCRHYQAHEGSVNVVKKRDINTFISAGYDGICRIWDRRSGEVEKTFTPSSWGKADRPKLGTHIRCLDVWDDWVVCGGGPSLSLWYLKQDEGFELLEMGATVIPRTVQFMQDSIIATGNDSHIFHWSLAGTVKYKVTSKLDCISDLIINTNCREQPFIVAAGSPTELNVFLDFGYLSHTVPLCRGI